MGDGITLWCDARTEEHTSDTISEAEDPPSLKRSEKIDQLTSGEKYGSMILSNEHNSTDTPPSFPLFNDAPKRIKRDNLSDALTSAATAVVGMLKGSDQSSAYLLEKSLIFQDDTWST